MVKFKGQCTGCNTRYFACIIIHRGNGRIVANPIPYQLCSSRTHYRMPSLHRDIFAYTNRCPRYSGNHGWRKAYIGYLNSGRCITARAGRFYVCINPYQISVRTVLGYIFHQKCIGGSTRYFKPIFIPLIGNIIRVVIFLVGRQCSQRKATVVEFFAGKTDIVQLFGIIRFYFQFRYLTAVQ